MQGRGKAQVTLGQEVLKSLLRCNKLLQHIIVNGKFEKSTDIIDNTWMNW